MKELDQGLTMNHNVKADLSGSKAYVLSGIKHQIA